MPARVSPALTLYVRTRSLPSGTVVSTATGLSSVPSSRNGPSTSRAARRRRRPGPPPRGSAGVGSRSTCADASASVGAAGAVVVPSRRRRRALGVGRRDRARCRRRRGRAADRERGAGPSPVGPPVSPGAARGDAQNDAPRTIPATATATTRSCPSRPRAGSADAVARTAGRATSAGRASRHQAGARRPPPAMRRVDSWRAAAAAIRSGWREGRSRVDSRLVGSAQASDDALDADRCVQQYGLLACGRPGARGGAGVGDS